MTASFPLLYNCTKHDGFIEHHGLNHTYVLWVLPDKQHVVFIHKTILAHRLTNRGNSFGELLQMKQNLDEPCKMISRPFVQALGYRPDYVVVTDTVDEAPTTVTCGYTMHTILQHASRNPTTEHIRTLAEGPGEPTGPRNQLGQALAALSQRLVSKGFLADPKYFPGAARDLRCRAAGMGEDELRLRRLFKVL